MRLRLLVTLIVLLVLVAAPSAYAAAIADDFSSDSGLWTYTGLRQVDSSLVYDYTAYRSSNGYMVLTDNQSQVGKAVLNQAVSPPFEASFDFRQIPSTPDLDGGGMTFMFSKDVNYTRAMAGALGFMPDWPPGSQIATGFGVEIDPYHNSWDPPAPHIALIKDNTFTHLATVQSLPAITDANWHHMDVDVDADAITVALDGVELLTWDGSTSTGYTGLGFSSATWWEANQRQVDNFSLTTPPPPPPPTPYLVWGSGQVTGPGNGLPSAYMPGVVVGQRSSLLGNVGSLGDVNLNNSSVDGALNTASQKSGSGTVGGVIAENIAMPYPADFPPIFPVVTPVEPVNTIVPALGNSGSYSFSPWTGTAKSYGAVSGGSNCQLHFDAPAGGTYFIDRLSLANGGDIWIDATKPVRIIVKNYLRVGSGTDVHIVGPESNVYWECQWAGTAANRYAFDSNGGSWVGNVFCPDGGINYGNGSESGTFHGYLWSGWDGCIGGSRQPAVYIEAGAEGAFAD